ncbi:MAG: zinc-dependent peptidase [bacterium]|nr:zinc-dependent peptidase [bacterium]
MQVIYKVDILFLRIYSSIILIIGIIGAISVKSILFLAVMMVVELIYLFFALRRPFRRRQAVKQSFPLEWKSVLVEYSPFYRGLNQEGRERFERDVQLFLSGFSVEGTRRRGVDTQTKLLVASGAAAMLHGRPGWEPPIPDGVVIYPGERFNRHYESGKGNFAGMATQRGPLILTEGSLEDSFRHPHDGYNVIYHELAHYFDLVGESGPWRDVFSGEWQRAFQGRSFLRPYAGTNEAELFAVAVEAFFEKPWEIKEQNLQLYEALEDIFNLDTAAIIAEE